MAKLALGFVGTAIGTSIGGTLLGVTAATIGGMIGSTIGGMIDNMLFPQHQTGPRLGDLSVQSSTYGQPLAKCYGPSNRIAGNVLYSSGLIETEHHQHQGKGKGLGPSTNITTFTYSTNMAISLCDARRKPIVGVKKVWANAKLIYSAAGLSGSIVPDPVSAKVWADFVVHDGSFSQMPDSYLEGVKGVGNVPAYRGTAYAVIWGLQLADYGNRPPNFEFLVEQDDGISVKEVLISICGDCGIDTNIVSVGNIAGDVEGYAIGSQSSGTAAIQPLALVYNFDTCDVGGGLRFTPRDGAAVATIESRFLAGHQGGENRPELITWTREKETSMPQEASISFPDPARDYQINSATQRRIAGSAQSNLSNTVPIVIDVATGAQLVDRMLWEKWNNRDKAVASADDRMIDLMPGKVYCFRTPAGYEPLRIKTKTRGANGVIPLELARDRSNVYQSTATGTPADIIPQTINVPEPSSLILIDSPILQDADDDTGFYFVVDGQAGWRGADVKRSSDAGVSYAEVAPVGRQSVIGTADGLGAGVTETIDYLNTVRVVLDDPTDELVACTELDLLNGRNAFWIGGGDGQDGEIAQFMTPTLIAAGVYDLSVLLRGRCGTEHAVGSHASGERFVLLDPDALYRVDYGPGDWQADRTYKAVSLLLTDADADPQQFTNYGEGKRPLSPVHVAGDTDPVTGDTEISWIRRSRLRQPGLGIGPVPLGESVEAYEIDIIVASVVVRTLSSSTPSVTYTAAMRAADGGGLKDIEVFQISDVRGRGRPAAAEV